LAPADDNDVTWWLLMTFADAHRCDREIVLPITAISLVAAQVKKLIDETLNARNMRLFQKD